MIQNPFMMMGINQHDNNNKHAKDGDHNDHKWAIMEDDDDHDTYNIPSPSCSSSTSSSSSSLLDDSSVSNGSTSTNSSELVDDASSSSSSSSSNIGPLYELSELISNLPIKRGLSKYFDGKSQSFTSLTSVRSLEDLAKKENPYRKKMKTCRSYGGGLMDSNKKPSYSTLPKPTISKKKVSRISSISSLSFQGRKNSSFDNRISKLCPTSVQKKF